MSNRGFYPNVGRRNVRLAYTFACVNHGSQKLEYASCREATVPLTYCAHFVGRQIFTIKLNSNSYYMHVVQIMAGSEFCPGSRP